MLLYRHRADGLIAQPVVAVADSYDLMALLHGAQRKSLLECMAWQLRPLRMLSSLTRFSCCLSWQILPVSPSGLLTCFGLQLWNQLKKDADNTFKSASDLVKRAEEAETSASAFRSSWEAAAQ